MIGGKDRFFSSVLYNMTRVINKMADMIEKSGGEVERRADELVIHTRGYVEPIMRLKDQIERLQDDFLSGDIESEARTNALKKLNNDLKELEAADEDAPAVPTRFVSLVSDLWIRYKLDGYIYEVSFDSNPFFPDRYCKIPEGGNARDYYRDDIECEDKFYYPNDMFNPVAKDETIENGAKALIKYLKTRKTSE